MLKHKTDSSYILNNATNDGINSWYDRYVKTSAKLVIRL